MKNSLIILLLIVFGSCRKTYDVTLPNQNWDQFNASNAVSLKDTVGKVLQGVYSISDGNVDFGGLTALKWTYNVKGIDTMYYMCMYCEKDVSYFILQGKRVDSTILLNGYWRKMTGTQTGKARFTIASDKGGRNLLRLMSRSAGDVTISGVYGNGDEEPGTQIRMSYLRPLYSARPFEIISNTGGGQTTDLLPASENSTEMIQLASRFGSTGIEVDVYLTKDGVPILYHDPDLSERLIKKNGLIGPIENYTYDQINALVRLIRFEEHIPTLRQGLETTVFNTPLHFVWLDIKYNGNLQIVKDLQQEYMQKAASLGRNVEIVIGIPDQNVLNNFKALPNYQNLPSLCELQPEYVQDVNAKIWAPRWTLGIQANDIAKLHAQGKRSFVWTLDVPENVKEYLYSGNYDGILTDYPSILAYYYYVRP